MKELVLKNISKKIGDETFLKDVNISINKGERLCLLGPSGCGKTTLLRITAGLEMPDSGDVLFCGKSLLDIPPHKRNFGMMFQEFALFPHRNVYENISFGLEMKKQVKAKIKSRVHEMLELVSLEGYNNRRVDELSGGERQRVALARTLAPEPEILMLDEPLGALDRLLRERLLADLCHILSKTGITTIFVTHDQNEAFAAADFVSVMDSGSIEQTDTPEKLYNNPVSKKIADFLGFQNIIKGRITKKGRADTLYGEFSLRSCDSDSFESKEVKFNFREIKGRKENRDINLLFHPDSASVISQQEFNKKDKDRFSGFVVNSFFQGSVKRVSVKTTHNDLFFFDMPRNTTLPEKGEMIFLSTKRAGLISTG
ncbi:MAG: ABC transporter ATP-binding protein [Thermodesulfobacteriota bacterium]|nr:ABC transporter ATP-binding protein [Thermodesulfobacteriota bacterium]